MASVLTVAGVLATVPGSERLATLGGWYRLLAVVLLLGALVTNKL